MFACIAVGAGGFLGAMLRYLIGLIPTPQSEFPFITLAINVAGSLAIGMIAGLAAKSGAMNDNINLFLKAGVCGGFTTFSTFALETQGLLAKGSAVSAVSYAVLSVLLCVAAVIMGDYIIRL